MSRTTDERSCEYINYKLIYKWRELAHTNTLTILEDTRKRFYIYKYIQEVNPPNSPINDEEVLLLTKEEQLQNNKLQVLANLFRVLSKTNTTIFVNCIDWFDILLYFIEHFECKWLFLFESIGLLIFPNFYKIIYLFFKQRPKTCNL
jgi:hypothetical protein